MSTTITAVAAPAHSAPRTTPQSIIHAHLSRLYRIAQRSDYVFASPLGPFYRGGRHYPLPRFVYFGPHTSDASLRLAFYAGWDHTEPRTTLSLLHFIEHLATQPDIGHGLNLSFFPLVDILGLIHGDDRDLATASWTLPAADHEEIEHLALDVRGTHYHGFVRLETTHDDAITVTLRVPDNDTAYTGVELLNSEDFGAWPVRWEGDASGHTAAITGPLSLAEDLPRQPFELTLAIPAGWTDAQHHEAVAHTLRNIILRQRAFEANAWHI
ncbi:hypothetical protein [Geminisphaera colitermitum]|uniref:hypothetical protein n=1 Tax=Geminisphaera colitermitum TaxID=1148786 RepID=UPI0005B9D467|nr:hypothetical protein [Geminisphaera colitermitum]